MKDGKMRSSGDQETTRVDDDPDLRVKKGEARSPEGQKIVRVDVDPNLLRNEGPRHGTRT